MTILQVLIGSALVGIIGMGTAAMLNHANNARLTKRLLTARDSIAKHLRGVAAHPMSLNFTMNQAANGTTLKNCVQSPAMNSCISGPQNNFTLYDSRGQQVSGPSSGAPAYYDLTGTRCPAGPNAACPFAAYTRFAAQCNVDCDSCGNVSIHITYFVDQAAPSIGGLTLKPVEFPGIVTPACTISTSAP